MRDAFLTELSEISCAGSRPLGATHSRTVRSDGNVDSSASNCIALTCAMPEMLTNSSKCLWSKSSCRTSVIASRRSLWIRSSRDATEPSNLEECSRSGSGALCRVKTVLILSALHRQTLDVADNRPQSHRNKTRGDPSSERHPTSVFSPKRLNKMEDSFKSALRSALIRWWAHREHKCQDFGICWRRVEI